MRLSVTQYSVYFIIGSIVAVIAVILREGIAWLIGDSPLYYMLSVAIVYIIGTLLSFILHRFITFKEKHVPFSFKKFYIFTVVAMLGMLLTAAVSAMFRYILYFDLIFLSYSGTISFCVAALLTSVISYYLNARFLFSNT